MIARERGIRGWRWTAFALSLSLLASTVESTAATEPAKSDKMPFRSWQELRSKDVVRQRLDFSCGAASLATLTTFFLGRRTSEEEALRIIRARYTPEEWKKKKQEGLSMEDLVFIARILGFEAEGGRLGLAALLKLNGPAIIHLDKGGGFQHFTVLRGIRGMTVYLADPIFGTYGMSLGMFVDQFTGAVLAVWKPGTPIPVDFALRMKKEDAVYDRIYDSIRGPAFYDRPQPLGPRF